ncbi:hypothetical protein ETI06_05750 [Macrococcoides goetzii]|nr:hypothetical protein [Macrococcus goetzii]TDM49977.1 hypothetical protein ETI06_05750 [Macrococcus goetzii]
MKTIKRERQIRLDELLRLVWNGEVKEGVYEINGLGRIHIDLNEFILINRNHVNKSEMFTITEEVEITEETKMKRLVCVHSHTNNISCYNDVSIEKALHLASFNKLTFKQIYLQYPDGSIGELIWTKERGLVD